MAGRLTAADLLDLWRKVLDGSYTQPMDLAGDGSGIEMFKAHAEAFARAAQAVDVTTQASFLLPSSIQTNPPAGGAALAAVLLDLTRTREYQLSIVLTAGNVLYEDPVGRRFTLDADVVFAAGAPQVTGQPAHAVVSGYGLNVVAGEISAFVQPGADFSNTGASVTVDAVSGEQLTDTGFPDVLVPGHVGQYLQITAGANLGAIRRVSAWQRNPDGTHTVTLADDADVPIPLTPEAGTVGWRMLEWGLDLGFAVTNPAAAAGGQSGLLDQLGRERRTPRAAGETDDAYRSRIATLPDVVSPNAIRRACNRILAVLNETIFMREVGTACLPGWYWDADAWDYDFTVRPADKFRLWLSLLEYRGFFLLGVPRRIDGEFGLFYDDAPAPVLGAFDTGGSGGFWDGYPATYWGRYVQAIWNQVDAIKAGGVGFDLYLVADDDPPC